MKPSKIFPKNNSNSLQNSQKSIKKGKENIHTPPLSE